MIDEETVWGSIWPVVETAVSATLHQDFTSLSNCLLPDQMAADLLELFGLTAFDIVFKTVLGQNELDLTQVVTTDDGVFIEFSWAGSEISRAGLPIDSAVSVLLWPENGRFLIKYINPGSLNLLLTETRARAILATAKIISRQDALQPEPWVLPPALFAGFLPLPLRKEAINDDVEALFLPGLKMREYGIISLLNARRLWRDFQAAGMQVANEPAVWAAAVEFVMNEQNARRMTETAVAKLYAAPPAKVIKQARFIKKTCHINGIDARYSDLPTIDLNFPDTP